MKKQQVFIKFLVAVSMCLPSTVFAQGPKEVKSSGFVSVPDEPETASSAPDSKPVVVKATPASQPAYDDSGLSPEEQLRKAWQDEMAAIKAKEEAEVKAAQTKIDFEKKRADTQREVAIKKRKIFDYQSKQDEYAEEIEHMKVEITELDGRSAEIEKDLKHAEERAKIQESKYTEVKSDLDGTKSNLKASLEKMRVTREAVAKKINNYMIEMQRMRAEIATSEADIARADNDKARAEAEEMQVRSQWSSLSARAQSLREDKSRIYAELKDMQNRLEVAKKDYLVVKAEWSKAEQEKIAAEQFSAKTRSQINSEMRKLESDTGYAFNQKAIAEAEKARLAAEIEKLKTDLAYVKKRNADAVAESDDAQGSVMESRLAFETAKADLVQELAVNETGKLKLDATAMKLRGLASSAESSDMVDAHKPWVVSKTCHITRTPASTGDKAGKLKLGERLIAAPAGGGYVKILNSSGKSAYVPMSCGHFAE